MFSGEPGLASGLGLSNLHLKITGEDDLGKIIRYFIFLVNYCLADTHQLFTGNSHQKLLLYEIRTQGFALAMVFKDICSSIKTEAIVFHSFVTLACAALVFFQICVELHG